MCFWATDMYATGCWKGAQQWAENREASSTVILIIHESSLHGLSTVEFIELGAWSSPTSKHQPVKKYEVKMKLCDQ
jgi:hypothetical protein